VRGGAPGSVPPSPAPTARRCSAPYDGQTTRGFQGRNIPLGFGFQIHACGEEKAGIPRRFGLGVSWNSCPNSSGRDEWLAFQADWKTMYSSATSRSWPFGPGA